jgi:tetratricopeptide (TPR) repeat protein
VVDDGHVTRDWAERVRAFWSSADDTEPDRMLSGMRALVDERPPGDARARYEWASLQDFLGMESAAIADYGAALDAGLDEEHEAQAVVQLASSLRNVGDPDAAIELLRSAKESPTTGAATRAFLALALHDAGHPAQALQVALLALAPTLPLYARAVSDYATALTDRRDALDASTEQR